MYDLLIKGAKIIDGAGNPWYRADVAVSDGKIARIAKDLPESCAKNVVQANDKVLSPGFIDVHSHDDGCFLYDKFNVAKLSQGVTTVVAGNCGVGPFPVNPKTAAYLQAYVAAFGMQPKPEWPDLKAYASAMEETGIAVNTAFLMPHGSVRVAVMGLENRVPTADEMSAMKDLIQKGMEQGAVGLSSGLIYPPGVYAKPEELAELSKPLKPYAGVYTTHMRDEGSRSLDSLEETYYVAKTAGVPTHISHHKLSGVASWGHSKLTIDSMQAMRDQGVDVTADVYPYLAGATLLATILPPFAHEGGEPKLIERLNDPAERAKIKQFILERDDWNNYAKAIRDWSDVHVIAPFDKRFDGKSLQDMAEIVGKDPIDALMDFIGKVGYKAGMVVFMMNEPDVEHILKAPFVCVATDGLPDTGAGATHPRAYGTFVKVLGHYVRENNLMSLEEAIRKMTSLPANRFGLGNRGIIKEGFAADLVLFDPDSVIDTATFGAPRGRAVGIESVWVAGQLTFDGKKPTGALAGQWIKNSYAKGTC